MHSTRPSLSATARPAILALALLWVGLAAPANAQSGCTEPEKNMQCSEMGTIKMDAQRDIRGDPVDIGVEVTLNTNYADHGARWFMFSVREAQADGAYPITVALTHFATDGGDIVTTRVEHTTPHELNLWVDGLDLPVGQTIHLNVNVGCTDRGAFRLETLVMAFDRGYAPVVDSSGAEASLFSYTLLGVNKETSAVSADGGSISTGHKLPALDAPLLTLGLLAAVVVVRRHVRNA